ncbi:MAG: N-acetyltransferase [Dehalococcoidia bacterium]|nr:N-acetyltransferase [Dehalococcoidia bacterium]
MAGVPKTFADVELIGKKVRLRPMRLDDAKLLLPLFSNPRVLENISFSGTPTLEGEIEWALAASTLPCIDHQGKMSYILAIEQIGKSAGIGTLGLHYRIDSRLLEIGYWLAVPYWGQGLVTDAARIMTTSLAFQHLDAVRVSAAIFAGNTRSKGVVEKLGFHLNGTRRSQMLVNGQWKDD